MIFNIVNFNKRLVTVLLLVAFVLFINKDLAVLKADNLYLSSVTQLIGKKVATIEGTNTANEVKHSFPFIDNFTTVPTVIDGILALKQGRIYAFFSDAPLLELAIKRFDGIGLLPDVVSIDSFGYGFRKGSPLIADFEKAIRELRMSGEMDKIKEIWLDTEEEHKVLPEQDWEAPNGTVGFACSAVYEPMCYRDSKGRAAGYDMHIALLVAKKLGIHIDFICVGYDSMIPMLLDGKVDICGTCLSITEERLKYIDMVENYRSKVQAVVCIPEIDTK